MYKSILSVIASLAVAGFLLVGTGSTASAQNMRNMHRNQHKATVTGCLQKGDEAGEYSIKARGKMYELTSAKVMLGDHVGHKVTVHGYITPETAEGSQNAAGGDIDMTVTSLKMVSKTCHM